MSAVADARRTLAARLTALALAQLVLIALVAFAIAQLTRPPAPRDLSGAMDEAAVTLRGVLPGELPARMRSVGARVGLELTLYGAEGEVIASSVDPPVPRREAHDGERRDGPPPDAVFGLGPPDRGPGDRGPPGMLERPFDGGAVLVARPVRPAPQYFGPILTFFAAALVLGLGGLFTARWIVRPLAVLRGAARKIADGDLSARSQLTRDDELGDVARAFDEMAERIEVARRAERELLANVSHELRTPLARLRVALELAELGHESGKAALADAATDLSELDSIVESVLSALRMEQSGDLSFGLPASSLREVQLSELLLGGRDRFRTRHPGRPVDVAIDGALPGVLVDPLLVRRVIENLLENAHKYSPEPSTPITLAARPLKDAVEVSITDRGMGIDAEDLSRVFEPFFRAERSRTRQAGGVGLGLTLCKRIVEAHGGTIAIESTPKVGTTVRVTLPTMPRDTDGHTAHKSP